MSSKNTKKPKAGKRPAGKSVRISSFAPTRIDLAGGTVDLWPIYLFLDRPTTLNVGIDLFAEAEIELVEGGSDRGVRLASEDQGHELVFSWDELFAGTVKPVPQLELHYKLLRHFALSLSKGSLASARRSHLTLKTRARSPAGAGLGGSSTLSVAMIGALGTWAKGAPYKPVDPMKDGEKFIEIIRDVETTVIQVPAGMQDYYGAMFGGLQVLHWLPGANQREWLPSPILKELESRLLLFYSGQSRNSGINNWALFKAFIDQQGGVREKFARIVSATHSLEAALRKKNWAGAAAAISEEWETRRSLAAGISTPLIDRAFEAAKKIAPVTGKVCGAGGGGCFFVYTPDRLSPDKIEQVKRCFVEVGMRSLPFRVVPRGLQIKVGKPGRVGRA